jgi:hypothetical protein
VIEAPELLGALNDDNVLGSLYNADDSRLALGIPADSAFVSGGHVEASATLTHLISHVGDGRRQPQGVGLFDREDVESKPLCCLPADTGEAG